MFLPGGIFLGGAFKATFTSPAGESSAIVSGAGTAAANGEYTYTGLDGNGNPYYNKSGTDPLASAISVNLDNDPIWFVLAADTTGLYYGGTTPPPQFPWQETVWGQDGGSPPSPTVTEGA